MEIRIKYDSGEIRNFICHDCRPNDVFTIRTEDPAYGDEYLEVRAKPKLSVRVVHNYPSNAQAHRGVGGAPAVDIHMDFARKLERERNRLRKEVSALTLEAAEKDAKYQRLWSEVRGGSQSDGGAATSYLKNYETAPFGQTDVPIESVILTRGLDRLAEIPVVLLRKLIDEVELELPPSNDQGDSLFPQKKIWNMTDQEPNSKPESAEEPNGKGLSSSVLLAFAESKEDSEMTIYCAEAYLLGKIAETSSDLVKGRAWEEFREACGGMEKLEYDHSQAVYAWEQWNRDSEG